MRGEGAGRRMRGAWLDVEESSVLLKQNGFLCAAPLLHRPAVGVKAVGARGIGRDEQGGSGLGIVDTEDANRQQSGLLAVEIEIGVGAEMLGMDHGAFPGTR